MISSLCFLLDYEKIENYQDSDDSSSDEDTTESPQVILRRETVYKTCWKRKSAIEGIGSGPSSSEVISYALELCRSVR
ncbi:SDA1-like protein, partial [Trifolium pratense]